jgi:hypothetical protein
MERAVEDNNASWVNENTIRTCLGYIVRLRPDLPGLPVKR